MPAFAKCWSETDVECEPGNPAKNKNKNKNKIHFPKKFSGESPRDVRVLFNPKKNILFFSIFFSKKEEKNEKEEKVPPNK